MDVIKIFNTKNKADGSQTRADTAESSNCTQAKWEKSIEEFDSSKELNQEGKGLSNRTVEN